MREIWTRGRRIVGVNRFTVLWQLIRMHHFNGDVSSSLDDVIWIFLRTFAIGKIDSHWCHFANRPSLCLSLSASFTGQHTIIKMWSTYHLSLSLAVAQWHKLSLPPSLSLSLSLSIYLSLSHWQCDQIGRFLKVLGCKFSYKVAQLFWQLARLLWNTSIFK